jgi:hypothetical protein
MRSIALLLAVPAVLLAACGETEIDDAKAERFISDALEEQIDAHVQSVECPDGLKAKTGAKFECTATGDDGSEGTIKVTETDDTGKVSVDAQFLPMRNLEEQIASGLEEQLGQKAELDCPEFVIPEKGGTFDCDVTIGQETRTVRVVQKDDQANVKYELLDQ